MKILMHVCCGPCTTYPLNALREQGHDPVGFFYNPNIHPYKEFKRREAALESLSRAKNFDVCWEREYGLREYLRKVVPQEEKRCLLCYEMRLRATAKQAQAMNIDAFTSTLLYSRYQNHEAIRSLGQQLAAETGLTFYYEDFREGWQQGIDLSIAMELYRQPYCGCIYSEQERYDKSWQKKNKLRT